MSQEEQDVVVGRLARERAEAHRQLALLDAEVQRYKDTLLRLVKCLGEPEYVVFDGDSWPPDLYEAAGWKMGEYRFSSSDIDVQKLRTLCKEVGQAKAKRDRLAQQLKNLGL